MRSPSLVCGKVAAAAAADIVVTLVPIYRSESKLTALKERLASEVDTAASTLPTILADSLDDEAVERMVSQAKVRKREQRKEDRGK